MNIESIIIGVVIGGLLTFILYYLWNKSTQIPKKLFHQLNIDYQELNTQTNFLKEHEKRQEDEQQKLNEEIGLKNDEIRHLSMDLSSLKTQIENYQEKIEEINQTLAKKETAITTAQNEINSLLEEKSTSTAHLKFINEKLETQKQEFEALRNTAHLQFEKIANRLLEEKTEKFTATNKSNIEILLNPLKEDLNKFKEKIEHTHKEDLTQRAALEERIKNLIEQTNKVSSEANNLANALKGDAQKRGNWGEVILERILESSGLSKDREYFIQQNIKTEEGKNVRPDVKIILPDNRVIIIDSKVSLIAYEQYVSDETDKETQKRTLAEHLKSTKDHINELSAKKYDNLEEDSLDFTMMFIPIEPAYLLAIQNMPDLWNYAYSKRILLVSPTTLIACLKLFSDLWRREWQNKNAMEIVARGEKLYEKFVGFTKNFEDLGKSIENSQAKYTDALRQLKDGNGNLIRQAIQLKELGLKSDKEIPGNFLSGNLE